MLQTVTRKSLFHTLFQVILLAVFLYLFLLSIDLMGNSMKMFGKGFAEALIASTSNPLVGLFIGILATSIIQSSSTTTSIVVGLVGSNALTVSNAIPIIMGANIGTSVTNILVSLAHLNRSVEFRRSFAASIVHDFFNFLTVLVLFPLQYFTNFLGHISRKLEILFQDAGGLTLFNPLKAITKPVISFLCDLIQQPWILLILALVLLFLALRQIVQVLRVLVVAKTGAWFDKVLFKNQSRAFTVGLILTILAQSSSITTSLVIPLAGAGLLTLRQIFPYTLGANIGTTVTAILASLITANANAVIVAFAHLLFNISGMAIWWPLKKVPLFFAESFAERAAKNKLLPIIFVLVTFFVIPLIVIFTIN
ncbi:MAG: Na/Pi symporter [Acidobacteria bacterium]|nr:Na/Pi symporter [Acidobacteriota bacterium]